MAKSRWKIMLLVPIILFAAGYVPKVPSWISSYSPKQGRVVDSATGEGIPDVSVVARGQWSSGGIYTTSSGCVYSVIATTDKDGRYRLPSAWKDLTPGAPWFDQHNRWEISAVKPGYAFTGDKVRLVMDPNRPAPPTYGTAATPVMSTGIFSLSVSDMALEKVDFSIKEKVYYDAQTAWVGGGCPEVNPEGFFRLRLQLFQDMKASVCALDPEMGIDAPTARGLRAFSTYLNADSESVFRFDQRLAKIDPAFQESSRNENHTYRAADLCQVMTAMGNDL